MDCSLAAYHSGVFMSENDLKKNLKKFIEIRNKNPLGRRRQRSDEIFWLIQYRFGVKTNGNLLFRDAQDRVKEYRMETFFMKPRLDGCEKKQVDEIISDYLLLEKLRLGTLRAKEIINCKNLEIRRILLERFGYEKFLKELRGTVIHSDGNSRLIKVEWSKEEEPVHLVRVKDASTERMYVLRVPPAVRTCKEAIAWTFNVTAEEYNPKLET